MIKLLIISTRFLMEFLGSLMYFHPHLSNFPVCSSLTLFSYLIIVVRPLKKAMLKEIGLADSPISFLTWMELLVVFLHVYFYMWEIWALRYKHVLHKVFAENYVLSSPLRDLFYSCYRVLSGRATHILNSYSYLPSPLSLSYNVYIKKQLISESSYYSQP